MWQKAPEISISSSLSPASIMRLARTTAMLAIGVFSISGISGPVTVLAQWERVQIDPRIEQHRRAEAERQPHGTENGGPKALQLRAHRFEEPETPEQRLDRILQGIKEGEIMIDRSSLSRWHPNAQELVDLGISISAAAPVSATPEFKVDGQGIGTLAAPWLTRSARFHTPLLDAILGTPEQVRIQNRMVVLDVTNRLGTVTATVSRGSDYSWLGESLSSRLIPNRRFQIKSTLDLDLLLGASTTVVHRGDALPKEWTGHLRQRGAYLRNSQLSQKENIGDFVRAAQALNRRAEPGRVKVLNALPNASGSIGLRWQLYKMGLKVGDATGWNRLQAEINGVRARSSYAVETATKESVLQELREGNNETVVIVAHNDDGLLHLPNGSTLSLDELSAVTRAEAPDRTVVLISCDAGVVNGRAPSASEVVINKNLAVNVLAHPAPISATKVPAMLEDFLINGKTIKESFPMLTPITENQTIENAQGDKNSNG